MTYLPTFPEPPMSDELASLLRRLCDEAEVPFDATLGALRAERLAASLIDDLRLRVLPPHTD
jgi:hypothetical protein